MRTSICLLALPAAALAMQVGTPSLRSVRCTSPHCVASLEKPISDKITSEEPLHVLIAGAGVGGLALANQLELSEANVKYTVLE
jgi:zeaxanthin epoxidase